MSTPGLKPAQLARARERTAKYWRGGGAHHATKTAVATQNARLPGVDYFKDPDEDDYQFSMALQWAPNVTVKQFCDRAANAAQTAELFWISEEFTDLALRAGQRMTDLSLAREDMPETSGFMYFDSPILVKHDPDIGEVAIQVVQWFPVPRGMWMIAYGLTERIYPGNQWVREALGILAPWSPGNGIPFGTYPDQAESAPTMATLLSTWAIMQQDRFANATTFEPAPMSPKKRRAAARRGDPLPSQNVRVVDLRRQPRATGDGVPAASEGRTIDYQMERAGHWKMQFYGAGRALRKRIWVDPYWVGEPDAPVRLKGETVHRLK